MVKKYLVTYDVGSDERRREVHDLLKVKLGGRPRGESAYEVESTSGLVDQLARHISKGDTMWVYTVSETPVKVFPENES